MKAVFGERKSKIFTLGLTPGGRLGAAIERLLFMFIALSLGGAIFFLPDYIGRYRAEEPVQGLLIGVLLGSVFLMSLVAASLRFFRNDLWVLDLDEGALIYQAGKIFGRGVQQSGIDFEHIDRFLVDIKPAPRESRLIVQLGDGGGERMFVTRIGGQSIGEVAQELADFLAAYSIDIPIDSVQPG